MKEPSLELSNYARYVTTWSSARGLSVTWRSVPEVLMGVVSELAEAYEAHRNNDRNDFNTQLADTFIRLLGIVGALDIDIETHIQTKMRKNETAPLLTRQ